MINGQRLFGKSIGSFLGFAGGGIVPKRFAAGGMVVPGTGNRDTVPALLTPGEGVLSVKAMQAIGSRAFNIPTAIGPGLAGNDYVAQPVEMHNVIMMDTRKVAEQVHQYNLKLS